MPDFEVIQTITTGSAVNEISFNSIPQTFDILQFVISAKDTNNNLANWMVMNVNGNSGNWYNVLLQHMGPNSGRTLEVLNNNRAFLGQIPGLYSNAWATMTLDVVNYSNASYTKSFICDTGFATNSDGTYGKGRQMTVGRTSGTAAITNLTFYSYGTNFTAGTMITMYGLKKA